MGVDKQSSPHKCPVAVLSCTKTGGGPGPCLTHTVQVSSSSFQDELDPLAGPIFPVLSATAAV